MGSLMSGQVSADQRIHGHSSPSEGSVVGAVVAAVWARPWLWPAAAAAAVRTAPRGWWRRWPPVPMPDAELWRFRLQTAYGGAGDTAPTPQDVRLFLQWCRDMRRWQRQ